METSNPPGCESSNITGTPLPMGKAAISAQSAASTKTLDSRQNLWRGGSKRKYEPTPEIDNAICERVKAMGPTALAAEVGWPVKAILRRAKELKAYKSNPAQDWTPKELQRFSSLAAEGVSDAEIQRLLKAEFRRERSLKAIKAKRSKLGITLGKADLSAFLSLTRKKYHSTPEIDALMLQIWREKKGRGAIAAIQAATGWPANVVVTRARDLGLSKPRGDGMPWTDAEEELLAELGFQSPQAIQIHLRNRLGSHRTITSIAAKRFRMRVPANLGGLNLHHLGMALGCGDKTIHRWLNAGYLRGIIRFPELQPVGRHVWFFPNEMIREFIRKHACEIDLCRVEKYWFIDLLAGGEKSRG